MDKNNNIEDFFNNSMDQFNDSPPDFIWDGISNRLDEKPPFYKKSRFWSVLGVAVLLGAITSFYVYSNQKEITELSRKIELLEEKNIVLEDNLIECGSNSEKLVHIINAYSFDDTKKETPVQQKSVIIPEQVIIEEEIEPAIIENNIQPSTYEHHPIQNDLTPKQSSSLSKPEESEEVIPSQLTEEIDSIIQENPELIEKGKTTEVPIFSIQEEGDTTSVEVDNIKPNIKESFKDWFKSKKEKLEFRKRKREKKEDN